MRNGRQVPEQLLLAAASGLWAAAFLAGSGPSGYLVPVLAAVGVLLLGRLPLTGSGTVAGAQLVAVALGVDPGNPWGLFPVLLAVYVVGRRCSVRVGVTVVAGFAAIATVADRMAVPTAVFGLFIFGGTWAFGRVVRSRTEAAAVASESVARLHATEPDEVARRVVAGERVRLAEDTVALIERAVRDMRRHADAAAPGLDRDAIAAVSTRGAEAVADLRRLLGLLRDEPPTDHPVAAARPWRGARAVDALTVLAVAALAVLEVAVLPGPTWSPLGLTGVLVLASGLLLRRTHLDLACLVAVGAVAGSLLTGVPLQHGFAETVALALLSWSVGGSLTRRDWVAWGALALVTLAAVAREDADNVAITAAIFALPLFAGRAWGERDREQQAAQREADALQGRIDEQVAEALARERLRIARELHDVSSHAVGVMVLQAGAAAALRATRPAEAREALAVVSRSAEEALAELTVLRDLLRAGALGSAADYVHVDLDLKPALADLVARMRTAGLDVTARCEAEELGPSLRTTVYRVAQEALTNAAKHAPGSRVVLDIRREGSHVVVEVRDDGAGEDADAQPGFGLVGLAERVRAHGGELSAGAVVGGGFAVRARMPVTGVAAPEVAQ